MASSQTYVLILDEQYRWLPQTDLPLNSAQLPIYVAASPEQAVAQAQAAAPCLVILVGDDHSWVRTQVHTLRQVTQATQATILALTESTHPNWEPHESTPDVDGFLVKPLTNDVLTSLIQSALVKQAYRSPFVSAAPQSDPAPLRIEDCSMG
jgi:DNA-binding NarL/FixJ family response regulator